MQLQSELRSTISDVTRRLESFEAAFLPAAGSPHVGGVHLQHRDGLSQRSRSTAQKSSVRARSQSVESQRSLSPGGIDNTKLSLDFGRTEALGSEVMVACDMAGLVDSTISAVEATPVLCDREREHQVLNRSSPGLMRVKGCSLATASGGKASLTRTTVGSTIARPTSMERRVPSSVEALPGKFGIAPPAVRTQLRHGKGRPVALSSSASEHHGTSWMSNAAPGLATPICCSFRRSGTTATAMSSPVKEAPRSPTVVSIMPTPMQVSRSPSSERMAAWISSQGTGMHTATRDLTPQPAHACRARQTRSGATGCYPSQRCSMAR